MREIGIVALLMLFLGRINRLCFRKDRIQWTAEGEWVPNGLGSGSPEGPETFSPFCSAERDKPRSAEWGLSRFSAQKPFNVTWPFGKLDQIFSENQIRSFHRTGSKPFRKLGPFGVRGGREESLQEATVIGDSLFDRITNSFREWQPPCHMNDSPVCIVSKAQTDTQTGQKRRPAR